MGADGSEVVICRLGMGEDRRQLEVFGLWPAASGVTLWWQVNRQTVLRGSALLVPWYLEVWCSLG
jgi:hypothetical protein